MLAMRPAAGGSGSKQLRCNRGYPAKIVPDRPRTCCGLLVDYATEDLLPACRRMVLESAKRGDNVGLDEFEDESETSGGSIEEVHDAFYWLFTGSEVFVGRRPDDDEPQAFIVIQPCMYAR
jgi:hypothetical protein